MKNFKKLFAFILFTVCAFTLFSQGETETAEQAPTLTTFILNGTIGLIIFYGGRIIKVIGSRKFDFKYWFKENGLSFGLSAGAIVLISFLSGSNPELLNTILGLIGLEVTEAVGTVAFGTFMAGTINTLVKQLTKKTVTETDGQGNKKE